MSLRSKAPLLALVLLLAGCGGGGGGSVSSTSPPPVTPPPIPAGYTPVIFFPNVTSSTQFATLGYQGPFASATAASLIGSGFSVSYDAAANNYVFDVPASQPGVYVSADPSSNIIQGRLTDPSNPGQLQPIGFAASRSGFEYTAWAGYQLDSTTGLMVFGTATPQSGVPITGSATYTALARGYGVGNVEGQATLQFNFGAGTLAGNLDVWDPEFNPGEVSFGHFAFTNTVVGIGSNSGKFSGELSDITSGQQGSFDGMLTGPNAEELMARWTATSLNPDNIMYGILVGKKN